MFTFGKFNKSFNNFDGTMHTVMITTYVHVGRNTQFYNTVYCNQICMQFLCHDIIEGTHTMS